MYANLNDFIQTYAVCNEWIGGRSPETEFEMLKEMLSDVPVLLRDFERKCEKHKKCKCDRGPYKLRDLESRAELSDSAYWLLQGSIPEEEMDIISEWIVHPHPVIYLYGEDFEKDFIKNYPLSKVILPIGATRVVNLLGCHNAVSILFERGNKLQYIDIVMWNKWPA